MIGELARMRWTIALAACLGFLVAPIGRSGWDVLLGYYDAARPIVRMQADVLSRDGNAITVALAGEKLRNCAFVRLHAYSAGMDGVMQSVYIRRKDIAENGQTRPIGKYDFGDWLIWPIDGTSKVVIYSQHDCDGRLVQTRLATLEVL